MSDFAIDQELCRGRQARLLAEMENLGVDLVVLTQRAHVQWLTGCYFPWLFEPAVALTAGGHCLLAAPGKFPEDAAADEVSTYEEKWLSTMRNDQRAASSDALASALEGKTHPKRLGVEFSTFGMHLLAKFDAQLMDVEPFLLHLRRRKDADELALIKKAIDGTAAMYARAREMLLDLAETYPRSSEAPEALLLAAGAHGGNYIGRFVVVVDEDIHPSDLWSVMWAISSRCDPVDDIDIIRNAWSGPLDPRKRAGDNYNSRALIDACRPYHWKDEFPHVAESSPELKKKTLEKFGWILDKL